MTDPRLIDSALVQEALTDAFRRRVGAGKAYSVDELAELTAIDARTLRAYQSGSSCPELTKLLRIAAVLGPGFMDEVLALSSLGRVQYLTDGCSTWRELNQDMARVNSELAEALADGNVDADEERRLAPKVQQLRERCDCWLERFRRRFQRPALRGVGS